jgi:hypothetical protein
MTRQEVIHAIVNLARVEAFELISAFVRCSLEGGANTVTGSQRMTS